MYHHHPYSYHRAFTIASSNRPHSYAVSSYTAAAAAAAHHHQHHHHSHGQQQQQQQAQLQHSHGHTGGQQHAPPSQGQSASQAAAGGGGQQQQSHTVPVYALNQNSNISAASYSTGEKTSSSQAPTQQSSGTAAVGGSAGGAYSFLAPNISRSICSTPVENGANNNSAANSSNANANNSNSTTGASGATSNSSSGNNTNSSSLPAALSNYRKCMAANTKKAKTEPILTQFHQAERFTFANTYVVWSEDHWKRVVFQDERKFNLDGPDGFSYYFHDLRNYERTLSQRPRGNSVYIYLIITAGGPIQIDICNAKRKLQKSIETILRERATIISKLNGDTDFILQDHNWIGNALPSAQEWLNTEGIKTQKWPTIAHDLNIMENVWGWLIREVFDGGRKFSRKDDLIFRIRESWARLPTDLITNLYSTLPERIMELYYTRGIYTNC